DVVLTPDKVANVLRTLDNDKAHGPDGIPARLLTETASQIAPSLYQLFNKSLRIGVVPFDWKLANVVPAHKKGDQEFVENYRPISLHSLVSKVLERCVFNTIKDHIFCRINPCQHGKQLDRGKQVDVIYLDMSKAFDKVSHKRLLLRLREFGFGGNTLNCKVTSGVPQGSILGPVLFLLYENDLPSSVKNSSIATYADDTKIFKEIHNIGDAASLQEVLSNFESCSSDMGLHLNTSKCKALRVTRKHRQIKYPYTLQDSMLENVESERDLGVWISNNLTWRKQDHEDAEVWCSKRSGNAPVLLMEKAKCYLIVGTIILAKMKATNLNEGVFALLASFYLLDFDYPRFLEIGLFSMHNYVFKDINVPQDVAGSFQSALTSFRTFKADLE
ncbi:Hypothetical predicted protein, partial [Paramuricea clavata]